MTGREGVSITLLILFLIWLTVVLMAVGTVIGVVWMVMT